MVCNITSVLAVITTLVLILSFSTDIIAGELIGAAVFRLIHKLRELRD